MKQFLAFGAASSEVGGNGEFSKIPLPSFI